jgi:hypothetical protein
MAYTLFASATHTLNEIKSFVILKYLAGAILVVSFIIYFIRSRKIQGHDKPLHFLLWLWLAPYIIFTIIWEPLNFELKIFFLPPLFILMGLGLKGINGRAGILKLAPALLAAVLFINNYYSSILPGADEKNNPDLQRAYFIRDNTEPLAEIYIAGVSKGYNKGKIYILYFSQRQSIIMDWRIKDMLTHDKKIKLNIKPNSYVLNELIEKGPALNELAKHHDIQPESIRKAFMKHRPRPSARHDDNFSIHLIQPNNFLTTDERR